MTLKHNKLIGFVFVIACAIFSFFYFTKGPYFSVIISSYNYAHYLPQTVNSILDSSFQNFELIIVNDGSTDNTSEILKQYKNNPKIRIIEQENQGLSISRNNAMKIAKGKYFWFVDADDWIDKDALAILWSKTKGKYIDIVSFNNVLVEEQTKEQKNIDYTQLPYTLDNNPKKNYNISSFFLQELYEYPVTSGKQIYRRAFIEKNNIYFPPKILFEDIAFFLESVFSDARISAVNKILYYKRKHPQSIVANRAKHFNSRIKICLEVYERITKKRKHIDIAYQISSLHFNSILAYWRELDDENKYRFYSDMVKLKNYIDEKSMTDPFWASKKDWYDNLINSDSVQKYKSKPENVEVTE